MWIRSQENELINLDKIRNITPNNGDIYAEDGILEDGILLGSYATKERALEVLDEIQQHILGKLLIPQFYFIPDNKTTEGYIKIPDGYYKIEQLPLVYEMPKE